MHKILHVMNSLPTSLKKNESSNEESNTVSQSSSVLGKRDPISTESAHDLEQIECSEVLLNLVHDKCARFDFQTVTDITDTPAASAIFSKESSTENNLASSMINTSQKQVSKSLWLQAPRTGSRSSRIGEEYQAVIT